MSTKIIKAAKAATALVEEIAVLQKRIREKA